MDPELCYALICTMMQMQYSVIGVLLFVVITHEEFFKAPER